MRHPIPALALSLAVLAASAHPAQAQLRRSIGSQQTSAQASEAAAPSHANRSNIRLFIGPAVDGGNRTGVLTRTHTTTLGPTTPGTGATFTNFNATSTTVTQEALGNAWGVMYGLEGTWWAGEKMGVAGSLFGSYLRAGYATNLLHSASLPANKDEGGTTTSLSEVVSLNQGYSLTINPVPVGGGVGSTVFGGFAVGPVTLREGRETGTNPDSFTSAGGINYGVSRSLLLNDFGVQGEYLLADSPAGGVSFVGGVAIPVGSLSRSTTARTVGAGGTGDTAEVVESVDDGPGTTYTRRRQYKLNETLKADSSFSAAGPLIGLNAHYNLSPSLRLYTKLGYAPSLLGTITTTQTTTRTNTLTTVIENVVGTPAGVAEGTQAQVINSATPQQGVASIGGTETMGTLGLAFQLGSFNLAVEGLARSYALSGGAIAAGALSPELIYGLRLGAGLAF